MFLAAPIERSLALKEGVATIRTQQMHIAELTVIVSPEYRNSRGKPAVACLTFRKSDLSITGNLHEETPDFISRPLGTPSIWVGDQAFNIAEYPRFVSAVKTILKRLTPTNPALTNARDTFISTIDDINLTENGACFVDLCGGINSVHTINSVNYITCGSNEAKLAILEMIGTSENGIIDKTFNLVKQLIEFGISGNAICAVANYLKKENKTIPIGYQLPNWEPLVRVAINYFDQNPTELTDHGLPSYNGGGLFREKVIQLARKQVQ